MWNDLESYKNQFLQWRFPTFKPETINEMVTQELSKVQMKRDTCKMPSEVVCQHSTYFEDRAKLAYGHWALPQLLKEACSDVAETQWRAINSLSELLMNPLEAQRAIDELDIVRILKNIFLRKRRNYQLEKFREVERLMHIFYILSIYLNGAQQIAIRRHLLIEFYIMIYNREKYMEVASKVLRNLSEKPKVLLHLLENSEALNFLATVYHKDRCAPHYPIALWTHLSHFIEVAPEKVIERGFFEVLHERIVGQVTDYHRLNMKCFALLLQCDLGQRKFDGCHGVKLMYRLFTEDAPLDTYEFVVLAFQNGIVGKRSLWRCREHADIANILVQLAKPRPPEPEKRGGDAAGAGGGHANADADSEENLERDKSVGGGGAAAATNSADYRNTRLQLYCLQSLRQMGQMPCIKTYIRDVCLSDIQHLHCLNEQNDCVRDDLALWLKRKVYHSQ